MRAQDFIKELRHDDIVEAIRRAEKQTSGEIRVFISRKDIEAPVTAAQAEFKRLKMDQTEEHNGVLIFVAPRMRKFAVIGDAGVHEKCGDVFWQELAAAMTGHFRQHQFTEGIIHGVTRAGELLARHFPCQAGDKNELPDDVEHD